MVISHKFRYLFIEIPVTGSWSIRHELCKIYDGQTILHKHATYPEFERIATEAEKDYFVFATVRNPLDSTVSSFFKKKTDHKGIYSGAESAIKARQIDYADLAFYKRLQKSNATFESSFSSSKVWERPYADMIDVSSKSLDFVIRFERLNEDFAEALRLIGLEPMRDIPVSNKTKGRSSDWKSYYTPSMITRVKQVYGPFMKKWGYEFPSEWGGYEHSWSKELEYYLAKTMKKLYLVYIRQNDGAHAEFIRKLNASLKKRFY